jgi:hypothetical protein
LIEHVPRIIEEGHVLWIHVTSPFCDTADDAAAIAAYGRALAAGTHDSLMSGLQLRSFIRSEEDPLNDDRKIEKWPRTQTLLDALPKAKSLDGDWKEGFHPVAEIWKLRKSVSCPCLAPGSSRHGTAWPSAPGAGCIGQSGRAVKRVPHKASLERERQQRGDPRMDHAGVPDPP